MPALAEAVDDRGAYGKELGNLAHREETCRTVQQECSKTLSKCCQSLLIRPVVCGRMSIVIANTCQRQIPPAIPLSGVHTAGVAGSNPAAPTTKQPNLQRFPSQVLGCRVTPSLLHDWCMTRPARSRVPPGEQLDHLSEAPSSAGRRTLLQLVLEGSVDGLPVAPRPYPGEGLQPCEGGVDHGPQSSAASVIASRMRCPGVPGIPRS